ncbi:MAG: DUF975 family protein [Leptospiraceae bacterium]
MAEQENPYQVSRASIETYGSMQEGVEFSVGRMLKLAFQGLTSNLGLTLVSSIVYAIVYFGAQMFWFCGGIIVTPHLVAGSISYGTGAVKGEPRLEDLFKPFNNFGGVFLAGLLYFLFLLVGYIAFFILYIMTAAIFAVSVESIISAGNMGSDVTEGLGEDGIMGLSMISIFGVLGLTINYFLARLDLVFPLVYDLRLGAWDAFVQSWRLTKGYGFKLFMGKLFVYFLPGFVIILPILLGLFVSLGFGALAPQNIGALNLVEGLFPLLIIVAILLSVVGIALKMTLEGAIAHLFLTPAVKEQLVPGYSENKPQFVSAPPVASRDIGSDGSAASLQESSSQQNPASDSASGTSTMDSGRDANNESGSAGSDSGEDRFPRPEDRKNDPFNPYN